MFDALVAIGRISLFHQCSSGRFEDTITKSTKLILMTKNLEQYLCTTKAGFKISQPVAS
jgi:hypothetical protein